MSELNANFTRLFICEGVEADQFGMGQSPCRSAFTLSIRERWGELERLTLRQKSGRKPLVEEVYAAVGVLLAEFCQEYGLEGLERYQRTHPYRFVAREGYTGCLDYFVEVDEDGDGFPTRHRLFHQTMYKKVEDFSTFLYDMLDLMVGQGELALDEGRYVPNPEAFDALSGVEGFEGLEVKTFAPRLLQYEEGWTKPWDVPQAPSDLSNICRSVPADDEVAEE